VSRERVLQRRLRALHTLDEAVGALRALSAQHFRAARALLPSARAYRGELAPLLGVLAPAAADPARAAPPGIVLVAADLGLVGDYTTRLVREALALRAERGSGPLLCLGHRAVSPLERASVRPERVQPAPASVAGLPRTLLPLVDAILALRRAGSLGPLWLVAARFEGAGQFRAVRVPLLPVEPPRDAAPVAASPYCDRVRLCSVVVREYLYAALYESLLDALASEHGKRLVMAESARSWLGERIAATSRLVAAIRREVATQEVLEVVTASRAARAEKGREGEAWARPS
jgi:F-type H+-transporting ATPase subunit gamma